MTIDRVEQVAKQTAGLTRGEFEALREWLDQYEAETWDRQIECDVAAGKLSELTSRALGDHQAGRSTKL